MSNNTQVHAQDTPMEDVPAQGQNTKQSLINVIARYKAKLDKLVIQYDEVIDTASIEQLQGRQADIANTQKVLDSFRYTYDREYGEKPESSLNKKPKKSGDTTPKVHDKMSAKDVPLFQVVGFAISDSKKNIYPTAVHFLDHFEKILNANTIGCKKTWKKWLPLAVPYDLDHWFNRKVFHHKGITWTEARKVIKKCFTAIDQQMHKAREAYTMVQLPGESVADYGIWFMNTARDGSLKDNSNLALEFLTSLQARIQENVQVAWTGKRGGRQPKKVSDILRVANSLSVYKRKRSEDPVSNTDSKHWCPHHNKRVKHKPEDCNLVKNKTKSKSETLYSKGLCIYCGDKWSKEHRCEEYRKAKKQKRESDHEKKINAIAAASSSNNDSANTEPATTNNDESESIDMDVLPHPADIIPDEEFEIFQISNIDKRDEKYVENRYNLIQLLYQL